MTSIAYFYDINSNLKLIAEYDMYEGRDDDLEVTDTDQFAIGAALSW